MALHDTITDLSGKAPAAQNRVDLLLSTLAASKPEDFNTLQAALRNPAIRPSVLTRALIKEYGSKVVTDHSVGDWRRRNLAEVNGL